MSLAIYTSAAWAANGGLQVADNATIEVRRESDGGLATIYSDRAGTVPITNPSAFGDSSGRFEFFADDGEYRVKVSQDGNEYTLRYQSIGDVASHSAETGGVHGIPVGERALHSGEVQDGIQDATVGKLMNVPAFGLGNVGGLEPIALLDQDLPVGIYTTTSAEGPGGTGSYNIIHTRRAADSGEFQLWLGDSASSPARFMFRYRTTGGWSDFMYSGAILSIIENSNGTAIRYDNGVQVCFKRDHVCTHSLAQVLSSTWSYPADFESAPFSITAIFAGVSIATRRNENSYSATQINNSMVYSSGSDRTGATIRVENNMDSPFASGDDSGPISVSAVGYWK